MFEGLVGFDRDMKVVPALAASWSTEDDRTWLLTLRKDVRFHDGALLTAADIQTALERGQRDPASSYKAQLSNVESLQAVEPGSLRIKTRWPDPLLLNRLASVRVARTNGVAPGDGRPIGTGPYRFVGWEKGRELVVEAFDGYWGEAPAYHKVRFVALEGGPQGLAALQRGQVDVLRSVPEALEPELRRISGVHVESRPSLVTYFLWFNAQPGAAGKNPFADKRVRTAIALAIDRPALVAALGGRAIPARELVQQGVFGYVAALPELKHDPETARALLKSAGYPSGFEVALQHRSGVSIETVAVLIRKMLGEVGIQVRLESPDWADVLEHWQAARIPFFLAGWRFDDGDALSFLRDCILTRNPQAGYGTFNAGFSSPVLDRLIEENGRMFGDMKRLKQYEALMRSAFDEMPLVPLYTGYDIYGVSDRVRWQPRLDGDLRAAEMTPQD
jgi:peptide/nickel transport system substrate-binding protein